MTRVFAIGAVALLLAVDLDAQCSDGTAPPCAAPRRAGIDANTIVILPFRLSGDPSLSYLREGMVDLLAAEFTGAGAPQAVDPSEVLSAWRAAGGRGGLGNARSMRLARDLGAGQLLVGAIVGNPRRVTIRAEILRSGDGARIGEPVVMEASPDSLAAMIASLSARLLSRGSGAWRLSASDPGTTSTEALKAYAIGHTARRSGNGEVASEQFSRAIALDSAFVLAGYWQLVHLRLDNLFPNDPPIFNLVWNERHRLSPAQRAYVEALLGANGVDNDDSRRDITLALRDHLFTFPRSGEAWAVFGDRLLHDGQLMGIQDTPQRAMVAFDRAIAIDTLPSLFGHAAVLAVAMGDTIGIKRWAALMRSRHLSHTDSAMMSFFPYALAIMRGDSRAAVNAARGRFIRASSHHAHLPTYWATYRLPAAEMDSIFAGLARSLTEDSSTFFAQYAGQALNNGRPTRAESLLAIIPNPATRDLVRLRWSHDDSAAVHRFDARFLRASNVNVPWATVCEVAQSRLRRGDTTNIRAYLQAIRSQPGFWQSFCVDLSEAIIASWTPQSDLRPLHRVDSIMRSIPRGLGAGGSPLWNHDIGVAYARRGEFRLAAEAAPRRFWGRSWRLARSYRDEARWALAAGDTAHAAEAARHYLQLYESPDASMVAERDSMRATFAPLISRRPGRPGP